MNLSTKLPAHDLLFMSLSEDWLLIHFTTAQAAVFPRNLAMVRFYFKALFGAATI